LGVKEVAEEDIAQERMAQEEQIMEARYTGRCRMTLERWRSGWCIRPARPLRELEGVERHFEDFLGWIPSPWRRLHMEERERAPPIEMSEREDKCIVKAEFAGMRKDEIDVSAVGDTVNIKGERKAERAGSRRRAVACVSEPMAAFSARSRCPPVWIQLGSRPATGTACWRSRCQKLKK